MQKLEQWNLLIKLLQGANEDQKKMVDLVIHYRDEKEILDPTIAGYFLLAIGLGKNPFADEMLLKYLVTGIKSKNLGIHYLSNEFLDRDLYYRLYSETLDKCEICGSWYKEVCDVCLNRAIDAFMEAEQND